MLRALLILSTLSLATMGSSVFAGPGLDIRPQMGSSEVADSSITLASIDLLLLNSGSELTCEDGGSRCQGASPSCASAKDAVSCLDADESMQCEWVCD